MFVPTLTVFDLLSGVQRSFLSLGYCLMCLPIIPVFSILPDIPTEPFCL